MFYALKNKYKLSRGFTLIEMAIVTMLIGIILAAMSPLYSHYLRKTEVENTQTALTEIKTAIGTFRSINGRYPCPASLESVKGDADYGRERCNNENPASDPLFGIAAGNCLDGICIEESVRRINYEHPVDGPQINQRPRIRVGFIPFRQLNLDEKEAYDGYGGRIVYAVTEHLAYADTFAVDGGGIEILDETNQTKLSQRGSGHFLILSYGEDKAGAYTHAGVQIPCPPDTAFQNENCDVEQRAIFQYSQIKNTENELTEYDDQLAYFTQHEIPLWQYSTALNHSDDVHQKPPGTVGFAIEEGNNVVQRAEISGAARAKDDESTVGEEGHYMLERICDENDRNCFRPKAVGGVIANGDGMPCPPGQFMFAISDSTARCVNDVVISCPPGTFVKRISNGQLECDAPPAPGPCNNTQVEICGNFFDTGFGSHGSTKTLGDCNGEQSFICLDGEWSPIGGPPECGCTPGSSTDEIPCGPGSTGGPKIVTTTIECDPCNVTVETDDSQCVCEPFTDERTDPCPQGYTGSGIFMENDWVCTPPPPHFNGWHEVDRDCSCTEDNRTRNDDCPPGMTGGPVVINEHFDCSLNPPRWVEVSRDESACVPETCQWNAGSLDPGGPYGFPQPPVLPSSCDCGTAPTNCSSPIGTGEYQHFTNCTCE